METSGSKPVLPVICGPTAIGKTALGLKIAQALNGEIVSADSRQVYRMMNIGTAKPTQKELQMVRHHLIDVVWPNENFHAARFIDLAHKAILDIRQRNKMPLVVGGTGLYIRALTKGLIDAPGADVAIREYFHNMAEKEGNYAVHAELESLDPDTADRIHPNDLIRTVRALEVFLQSGRSLSKLQKEHNFKHDAYLTRIIGLTCDREDLYQRIEERCESMFEVGLVEEAEQIRNAGYDPNLKILKTIGYRQAFAFINGEISRKDAIEDLKKSTRRYAKQQLTWFRKDKSIIWLESSTDFVTIHKLIENLHVI